MGFVVLPWSVWADVVVGSTRQDVIESEGEPGAEFKREGRTILYYDGREFELAEGKVVKVPKIGGD
jgi:hypothetical protein